MRSRTGVPSDIVHDKKIFTNKDIHYRLLKGDTVAVIGNIEQIWAVKKLVQTFQTKQETEEKYK